MKRFLYFNKIGAVLLAAAGLFVTNASAETKTEGFDTFKGYDLSTLPEGWDYKATSYFFQAENDIFHNKKPSIYVGSSNTANYLITPMLEGEFSFYLRNSGKDKQASVKAFACTFDGTDLVISKELGSQTLQKVSSGTQPWVEVKFSSASPTRVALLLSTACFDDFKYTPATMASGPVLKVQDYVSGSTFDFGGVPVSEGTQHTFVMLNTGSETLNVSSVKVTGGYTIVEGNEPVSIEAGSSSEIILATPAANASGQLEIESDAPDTPYVINLTSLYKVPAPEMTVSATSVSFGRATGNVSESLTIGNEGDADLNVTVSCDNPRFKVEPASLTVTPGSSSTLTVTFQFDETAIGSHSGVVTLTPNAGEEISVNVSAYILDPDTWTEYFEAGVLPDGWEAGELWSFVNGEAKAEYKYNQTSYLVTPPLTVTAGDELNFNYRATGSFVTIKIQASKNNGEFKDLATIDGLNKMSEFRTYTIKDLDEGTYRFRFANDDYVLDNFEGLRLNMNAPEMVLSPLEDAVFGKVLQRPEPKTYTVTNKGTGLLNVKIESSTADFTVEPSTLTDIAKGESETFTVTFNYNLNDLGDKSALISVTPTYDETASITFEASATSKDPLVWEEDFEEGKLPEYWSTTGWKITNSGYGNNGTYMAYAGNDDNVTITTPRLLAIADEELTFEIGGGTDTTDKLTVEYSHDLNNWTELESSPFTEKGYKTFVAPKTGFYYLRFKGKYASLDNFYGFMLAPKTHNLSVTGQNIPDSGNQYAEYEASLTVMEMNGSEETATARLIIDGNTVAESEPVVINANSSYTFDLSFTPEEPLNGVTAEIVVSYSGEETYSEPVSITIDPAMVLSEDEESSLQEGRVPVLVFDYKAETGWNIITTPFALTRQILNEIFGPRHTVFEFYSHDNGEMIFKEANIFAAGYPYVVLAYDAEEAMDKVILQDILIERTTGQSDMRNGVSFHGNLSPMTNEELNEFHIMSNPGNNTVRINDPSEENPKLVKCGSEDTLRAYRGYVELPSSAETIPILRFFRNDGTETGITDITIDKDQNGVIYNLNGFKVVKPSAPGIYIINGQKVIIK